MKNVKKAKRIQIWDQTLSQVKKMSVTVVTVGESSPYHNHRYLRMIYLGAGVNIIILILITTLNIIFIFTDWAGRDPASVK